VCKGLGVMRNLSPPQTPALLAPAVPEPFELPDEARREIAAVLGLSVLPPLMAKTLECNIGIYKTNSRLGVKATLGSTIAAIERRAGRRRCIRNSARAFHKPPAQRDRPGDIL
jgi:hypothetical protein